MHVLSVQITCVHLNMDFFLESVEFMDYKCLFNVVL